MATEKAPGLVWRARRNGSSVPYWVAPKELVKAGYRPKVVRLHYDPGDPMLLSRCHFLQADAHRWAAENRQNKTAVPYDGTFASLVRYYETHPDSPYRELRSETARTYRKTMALLMQSVGERLVKNVDASDIRRWSKELAEEHSKGWAYYTINVLKAVLSFGTTKRFDDCKRLRIELREAKFRAPSARKERLTYAQVRAFREAAHAMGYGWMALILTFQFECGLRRRDVIGEWIADEIGTDGIRNGKRVWRDGLTWGHIDANGVLRKLISKTMFTSEMVAVHVIAAYPDLAHELNLARGLIDPKFERVGPIIINHLTKLPPTAEQCRHYFRLIARRAGIPDNVWNMDARAGAVTEAYESGATEEEAMALATHTQAKTSHGYDREQIERSRRTAAKRVGARKE